jgi:diguanylate cyclase (GGDEF)-like protein
MAYLADITLRQGIALLVIIVSVLAGGTFLAIQLTTNYLVNEDARANARDWAEFLVANVADLKQIATGELPSTASLAFLDAARKSNKVFRYVIFNQRGYSQFVADDQGSSSVGLSEFSAEAAKSVALKQTIVNTSEGDGQKTPEYFGHAYVPIIVDGEAVGAVAAFVNETAQHTRFRNAFLIAALSLCTLIAFSFSVPAVAWYRRTREKQHTERRIRYLAHHDVLTGLANRAQLIERLQRMLASLPPDSPQMAVHFIDLDRFKEINDTLGHDVGDFLLQTISDRMRKCARIEDLVARLGGDEFVVIQSHVSGKPQAEAFAKRLVESLSQPVIFGQQEIAATITIGVAMAPEDGNTSERILKSADLALYAGKSAGRDCVRFFSPELDDALQERIRLEKLIRDAVVNNRFELHYQPIYEGDVNHLAGYEALLRLPALDGLYISPTTVIPLAEEMHLIDKIGAWVIYEACRTAAAWPSSLIVSVNLSPSQFASGTIVETVADALRQSGLAPKRLELEITETLLLGNIENTVEQLRALKAFGVAIAMDDFGTGYSSLSYLWKFPFDKIKIDRSFMDGFEKPGRDVETIIKTIIALSRELNMRVTAEGVETEGQASFLFNAHVDQVQGFYLGRPIPASEVGAHMIRAFRETLPSSDDVKPAETAVPRRNGAASQ